ncbi:hypothetical protein NQ176_g3600 [Zarea fungicola]|uniref:Uncharacterized protein n=1 Tax=Zarea fungicola TaxID=93591 RepID=A0ACC1NHL2_9HYPO|nr:hypothetical protein NQ176_g3600 [Lecanicillium fungicola]
MESSAEQLQVKLNGLEKELVKLRREYYDIQSAIKARKGTLDSLKSTNDSSTTNNKYAACLELEGAIAELFQREYEISTATLDTENRINILRNQLSTI